jgi:hypothetical protein
MRTTIDMEDDVVLVAKAVAAARGVSIGKAVSAMVRESLARPVSFDSADGFPVMPALPPGIGEPLTPERVAELMDAEDADASGRLLAQ